MRLRAVAWYMDSQAIKWNIARGPGTISADGIYTSPKTPQSGSVTVQASALDPSKTVSITIPLVFGDMQVNPPALSVAHSLSRKLSATIGGVPYSNVTWQANLGTIDQTGLYTAPANVDKDSPAVVTVTSKDDPSKTATVKVTVLDKAPTIRINCGDLGELRDAGGNIWAADPGSAGAPSTAYNIRNPIANAPADLQPLYQSARYLYGGGRFWYTLAVPNSTYRVTLKFADYAPNRAPGVFGESVLINGVMVLRNFDIVEAAGGSLKAIDKTFTVVVKGSSLKLEFVSEAGRVAQINGFEIEDSGSSAK